MQAVVGKSCWEEAAFIICLAGFIRKQKWNNVKSFYVVYYRGYVGCCLKNSHKIEIDDENGHIVIEVFVKVCVFQPKS